MTRREPWEGSQTLPRSGFAGRSHASAISLASWALFSAAVVLAAGCGPVEYLSQVNGRAATALAQAHRQGAEQLAPYEYTAAAAYLLKAREEASRSAYQRAIAYGQRSEELARRAEAVARARGWRGKPPSGAPPSPPGPAAGPR